MIPASQSEWYSTRWLSLLKTLVSITLLARGWLTYRWDSPIRGLLWNEEFFGPILLRCFKLDWQTYAANSDQGISTFLEICGLVLIVSALIPWLPIKKRVAVALIFPAITILLVDSFARFVESGFQFGMSIEHALQAGAPIVWLLAIRIQTTHRTWINLVKLLVVLTFIGHGCYAVGIHPVPWDFQSMTSDLIGLSEMGALQFLQIVGVLDFIVAIGLFIRPIEKYALIYTVLWGAATAVARIASYPTEIDPWLAETLVRTAHWVSPLLILLAQKKNINTSTQSTSLHSSS